MEKKLDITENTDKIGGITVDLVIGEEKITTGSNPITSYSFWADMEKCVQRALYRIKTKNPKLGFDFNLQSMMMTADEKRARLTEHIKEKVPNIDVERALGLFEAELKKIEQRGPDDNHPNPYLKFPVDSDIVRHLLCTVIGEYNKEVIKTETK